MAHFLFNFSGGGREAATALLVAKMWGIGREEPHGASLAAGDDALIYVAATREFIGRAQLASAVRDWTPSEAAAYPGDSSRGVLLADVEPWDPAVPLDAAVERIDPAATNPIVQENARSGFRSGVVRVTDNESQAVLALRREARGSTSTEAEAP